MSDAINSLASEASSASSYLSSAVAATNPSSVGSFTVTTGSLMSQNFVLDANGMDSSSPIVISGSGVVTPGTNSGGKLVTETGSSYTTNWTTSDLTAGGYVITNLSVGDIISKTWNNIGTLNGNGLSVTVIFTVGATQNSNPDMVLSDNFGTFMSANGFSGSFQISYTWAGGPNAGQALSLDELNSMSILGASLTPQTYGTDTAQATEYLTTQDAKGAILSNDANSPSEVGATLVVDGTSLGLPENNMVIFGGVSRNAAVTDGNSNSYALSYGVSFANFTTTTPTFYFGTYNYTTGETFNEVNHLMMSSALAYNPPILTVIVPTIVAPVIATPASPTPLSANYNVTELDIIATPPAITAPITSTAVINKPIDLTQGGQVTGEDNGELIAYPANDVVVTITDSSGNTTTLPEGTTDYTPTTSGNYTVTYTYTSANGTASTTTNFSVPDTVTTNYVDSSGSSLAPSNVQTVEVGNGYNTSAFIVEGYILTTIPSNASGTISSGDGPVQVTYVYSPLGSYVVTNPDGSIDDTIYPNNPNDPTQPGSPTNVIPYVPGYTPEGPDGTALTPVDPSDPSQGYLPPAIPDDPTQDTPIHYIKNTTTEDTKDSGKPRESGEKSVRTSDKTIGSTIDSILGVSPVSASTLTLPGNDLPKTGDDEKMSKAISGVGLAMLLGILGLANVNKRKKSDD